MGLIEGYDSTKNKMLPVQVTDTYALKVSAEASTAIIGKVSIDQVTANANKVVTKSGSLTALEAGTAEIGNVKNSGTFAVQSTIVNQGKQASDTITLAAGVGAHSALDVISTEAGEVLEFASLGVANDLICILGARMKYNGNAVPTSSTGYRLHLYNASPTAIADNAAFNVPADDLAKYIGYIPLSVLSDLGDNCASVDNNINFTAKLVGTGLFGILQCVAGETPAASCVFTITLNSVAL